MAKVKRRVRAVYRAMLTHPKGQQYIDHIGQKAFDALPSEKRSCYELWQHRPCTPDDLPRLYRLTKRLQEQLGGKGDTDPARVLAMLERIDYYLAPHIVIGHPPHIAAEGLTSRQLRTLNDLADLARDARSFVRQLDREATFSAAQETLTKVIASIGRDVKLLCDLQDEARSMWANGIDIIKDVTLESVARKLRRRDEDVRRVMRENEDRLRNEPPDAAAM